MFDVIAFLNLIIFIACALLLIFKPKPIIKFIGNIYWYMGRFTAIGKSEKTKKYFIGENTFWFRTFGIIMLMIAIVSLFVQINE